MLPIEYTIAVPAARLLDPARLHESQAQEVEIGRNLRQMMSDGR